MGLVAIPYAPRVHQRQFHDAFERTHPRATVLVCHRRFGKSVMCINELLRQAAQCALERPRYAYMAPLYRQAKTIAWDYLRHYASPIPGTEFNEAELACTLPNGARIELLGAQDYHYLRGRYLDGIVLDEYAYMIPEAWTQVIRPALVDRHGWAVFIGTPLGRNHFYALYEKARARPEFLTALWPASQTGIVPDAELAAARGDMSPEEYAQEFECSFEAAIRGAYYAQQVSAARADGRIRPLPIEPAVPVETWWDIGFSDATAIIFTQTVAREIRLIDYVEESGQALPYYAKTLQERPYLYARHHLPHDAEKTELGTGKSIYEQLRGLGLKPLTIGRALPVMDGIQTARSFMARCWFDERRCARLLDRLATYRADWDEKRQTFRDKPYHDAASHGADAFRYLAVDHRTPGQAGTRPEVKSWFDPLTHGRPAVKPRVVSRWTP